MNAISKREYLDRIAQIVTKEQHDALTKYLNGLSEEDWSEIQSGIQEAMTLKESLNMQKSILEKSKTNIKDTAWYSMQATQISGERNKDCIDGIKKTSPSDNIFLTRKEDEFLIDLWETERINVTIPSDLFFANTVPLLDSVITIDERPNGGTVCDARIIIFEDYKERIEKANMDEAISVGVLVPMVSVNKDFFLPIIVVKGTDSLVGAGFGVFDNRHINSVPNGALAQVFVQWMETWYGIQIALLHPAVKDVFKNPSVGVWSENRPSKKRKRKVKYVRNHYLTIADIERVTGCEKERKINRKCLAWYVIGHWRTYQNGSKIFVKPYWKGPLRDLKKNADGDEREREI